jgi:four helix bundle protein
MLPWWLDGLAAGQGNAPMRKFESLLVWRRSHDLVLQLYKTTRPFPTEEKYGLQSQLRRAAVSIAANIAEGCKRSSDAEFARFVSIAEGSASEVDYLLMLSMDLGYVEHRHCADLRNAVADVSKMLDALRITLRNSTN